MDLKFDSRRKRSCGSMARGEGKINIKKVDKKLMKYKIIRQLKKIRIAMDNDDIRVCKSLISKLIKDLSDKK